MGRVLVAGIGNIFRSDDGFGVEVVRRLAETPLGDDVHVRDFGVSGVHLAFEMSSGSYHTIILVDAASHGATPGTVFALEPDVEPLDSDAVDAHDLTPAAVLAWVHRVGGACCRVIVVGCEPESLDDSIGLSATVSDAVDVAVSLVRDLVTGTSIEA